MLQKLHLKRRKAHSRQDTDNSHFLSRINSDTSALCITARLSSRPGTWTLQQAQQSAQHTSTAPAPNSQPEPDNQPSVHPVAPASLPRIGFRCPLYRSHIWRGQCSAAIETVRLMYLVHHATLPLKYLKYLKYLKCCLCGV